MDVNNNTSQNNEQATVPNNNNPISPQIKKKKQGVRWKEEVQVNIVENWKQYNVLDDESEQSSCHCILF